jgi:hypothetical protein
MNLTKSDEEYHTCIDDATNAILDAVNTRLFDRHGKRAYTTAEITSELETVIGNVRAWATEAYIYGNLDVILKYPYKGD